MRDIDYWFECLDQSGIAAPQLVKRLGMVSNIKLYSTIGS
jgi:hypothetical protein